MFLTTYRPLYILILPTSSRVELRINTLASLVAHVIRTFQDWDGIFATAPPVHATSWYTIDSSCGGSTCHMAENLLRTRDLRREGHHLQDSASSAKARRTTSFLAAVTFLSGSEDIT